VAQSVVVTWPHAAPLEAAWAAALDALATLDPWTLDDTPDADGRPRVAALTPLDAATLTTRLDALGLPLGCQVHVEAPRLSARFDERARATRVGPLWVVPPERAVPSGARHVLRVDALRAFGAGTHETTGMCLAWIVAHAPLGAVLDVGTGSGVLALAALSLGAPSAVGVEIDPDARVTARANARRMGLALQVPEDGLEAIEGAFDVVLANVRTPVLVAHAARLAARTRPGGALVVSGVRVEEQAELVEAFAPHVGAPVHVEVVGEWCRIDYARGPA
jgi:ribosomal protein L11 methylase PrmA